jgi:hypothetical protein
MIRIRITPTRTRPDLIIRSDQFTCWTPKSPHIVGKLNKLGPELAAGCGPELAAGCGLAVFAVVVFVPALTINFCSWLKLSLTVYLPRALIVLE